MNATRNFHDLLTEVEEISREDNGLLITAHKTLHTRLHLLWTVLAEVLLMEDLTAQFDELDRFFSAVEEADHDFICSCSTRVAAGSLKDFEVTKLLMINRLFTQSSRMLILSLHALLEHPSPQVIEESLLGAPA